MQATTTPTHNFRIRKKKVNNSYILHILNTYCIKSTKQGIHADTLYFHLPIHKKRRNNISPKMKKNSPHHPVGMARGILSSIYFGLNTSYSWCIKNQRSYCGISGLKSRTVCGTFTPLRAASLRVLCISLCASRKSRFNCVY